VVAEVTEQTENPLASSYTNSSVASPIADGHTFDVEEAVLSSKKTRGKKWTGGLKRRRKEAGKSDNGQQPGGLVDTEEYSPLPHDGSSAVVGQSSAVDGADELAAIEIPNDDDFELGDDSTAEQIGDLL
jgi:hypothetical protein